MKNNLEQHSDYLQMRLSKFAAQYRSSDEGSDLEKQVLAEYYKTFQQLVELNGNIVALDPDAELPDHLMPKVYIDFWLNGKNTKNDSNCK